MKRRNVTPSGRSAVSVALARSARGMVLPFALILGMTLHGSPPSQQRIVSLPICAYRLCPARSGAALTATRGMNWLNVSLVVIALCMIGWSPPIVVQSIREAQRGSLT